MNKVRKQFVFYAILAVFVLLTVLLAILNAINFTMVAQDADRITEEIARGAGTLGAPDGQEREGSPADKDFRRGVMGPDSPELPFSARYFTVRFDKSGASEVVAFRISAFTREEAVDLASRLKKETTGWTHTVYRFRVYRDGDFTCVTVVDQGRELLPSYRILVISCVGEAVGLAVCLAFLILVSRRLFRPLEDADRKQKRFMSEAETEFKIPLTVIGAAAELIEREHGPSEETRSIRRQVGKMTELNRRLGEFAILREERDRSECDLSALLTEETDRALPRWEAAGITLEREIAPALTLAAREDALRKMIGELIENSVRFSVSRVAFSLKPENGRIVLTVSNDTTLSDRDAEEAFDRFIRFENAAGKPGSGLGLSFVRETVRDHNGRLSAAVEGGVFTLRIVL